jgi:hypothetical protein
VQQRLGYRHEGGNRTVRTPLKASPASPPVAGLPPSVSVDLRPST